MEPGLLQPGNGAGHTRRQHDALDQMIGQFGGNSLMRPFIRIGTFLQQLRSVFPDGVVTGHEQHTALLQGQDGVAGGAEHTIGIFMRRNVGWCIIWVDQSVGFEIVAGHRSELILVPHRCRFCCKLID
jgi:hypothetical protein